MALKWTEDLAVGVDEIDNQHKELYNRINALIDAMDQRKDKEEIGKVVAFLEKYIVQHFGTEEGYMIKYAYPEFAAHKQGHKDFIATFEIIKKKYTEKGPCLEVVISIHNRIGDWLRKHIPVVDKAFANFLKTRRQ